MSNGILPFGYDLGIQLSHGYCGGFPWHPQYAGPLALWYAGDFPSAYYTEDSGVFTNITNRGSLGGTLASASTNRPTLGNLQVGDSSRQVVTYDDSNDFHASSLAASGWSDAHQAWTWIISFRGTGTGEILATHAKGTTAAGIDIYYDASAEKITVSVGNGSALALSVSSTAGLLPPNEVHVLTVTYSDTAGYTIRINGSADVSDALSAETTPDNPSGTLRIGTDTSSNLPFGGNVCEIYGYSTVLPAGVISQIESYLINKWIDQAVPVDLGFELWLRGDLGLTIDSGNGEAGDQIAAWADQSGSAHHATQNTDSKQLTVDSADIDFDGYASLEGDGSSDCMSLAAGGGWSSGTSHTLAAIVDVDTDATPQFLFDAQTGRFLIIVNYTGEVGFYDTTYRLAGAAVTGPQYLLWLMDDANDVFNVYRGGVFVGTNAYPNSIALGGTVGIMARFAGDTAFVDGKLAELGWKDDLLSDSEIWTLNEYLYLRYPSLWTHASLGVSTAALVVPGAVGSIDNEAYFCAVPDGYEHDGSGNVTAWRDLSVSREPLGSDMDMEGADTSAWTLSRGLGALTKETSDPYEGSRCIRMTYAASWDAAEQDLLLVGGAYRAKGVMRGDGTAVPLIHDASATWWTGTSSGSWQEADAVAVASNTKLRLRKESGSGNYIEADDFTLIRCCDGIQPTAANQPVWTANAGDGLPAVLFTGGNSERVYTACVANASEGTLLARVKKSSTAGTQVIIGTVDAGGDRLQLWAAGGGTWRAGIGATSSIDSGVAVTTNFTDLALTWDGSNEVIDVNGTRVSQAAGETASTQAVNIGCNNNNGALSAYFTGHIRAVRVFARALTAAEIEREFELIDEDLES